YVLTVDDPRVRAPAVAATMQSRLTVQQQRLETLSEEAAEPARGDLREALVTTERGRQLVADPQPVERALGRRPSAPIPVAAAEPTVQREPTSRPTSPTPTSVPNVIVADKHDDEARHDDDRP